MSKWSVLLPVSLAVLAVPSLLSAQAPIVFEDLSQKSGIAPVLEHWRLAHAGAWGDADGDGRPDLYVGAFADRSEFKKPGAPLPNYLFLNKPEGFVLSPEKAVQMERQFGRTSSALFVDLDNDGDLDLFVAKHGDIAALPQNVLLENTGGGHFRDVTPTGGDWPRPIGTRNVAALDLDGDGRLELILADGTYENWKNDGGRLYVLKKNADWTFKDIGADYGLPTQGACAMGLAIGDVNDDGVFDFYVTDCNRMFVSGSDGKYRECTPEVFALPAKRDRETLHSVGAAFGDLNGDGLADLVVTEHIPGAYLHVYLNQGVENGMPKFVHVSERIGLDKPFPKKGLTDVVVKSGNVAIRDVDNDGRNDIMLAIIYKADNGAIQPLVLQNLGNAAGAAPQTQTSAPAITAPLPQFKIPPYERFIGYYAPAPVGDYDRDGRVDIFMPSWFDEHPNYLFRNVTAGGHWLTVAVKGDGKKFNLMGVGAIVRVYKAGEAGDPKALVGRYDIAIGTGYSSGEEALAHLGLGERTQVDVEVSWGGRKVVRKGVAADQAIEIEFPGK